MVPLYIVRALSRFQNVTALGIWSWLVSCPCRSHGKGMGDRSPSLAISVGAYGRLLFHCFAGCSYKDILTSARLCRTDLLPCSLEENGDVLLVMASQEPVAPFGSEAAGIDWDLRDKVYRRFLFLQPLDKKDLTHLVKTRGFTREQCNHFGYVSWDSQFYSETTLNILFDEFGESLFQVPGFVLRDTGEIGYWAEGKGILIPVRDLQNRVVALKVRGEREDSGKYFYFGKGSTAPVHCPSPPSLFPMNKDRVVVTEGELKADYYCVNSDKYAVGIPGVSQHWKGIPILEEMGAKEVLIAFDWADCQSNSSVGKELRRFVKALRDKGFIAGIQTWIGPKGVDDALRVGTPLSEVWGVEEVDKLLESTKKKVIKWEPKPFPVEVFPCSVQRIVEGISTGLPCPKDFIGVGCLTVAGAALGAVRVLETLEGWREGPNLYAAIIATPSTKKSAAAKNTAHIALGVIQNQLVESNKALEADWDKGKMVYAVQRKVYQKLLTKFLAANPGTSPNSPDAPVAPVPVGDCPKGEDLVVDDITMESLVQSLAASPRGLILYKDELLSLFTDMNKYRGGKGSDRQYLLSLWSGSPIKVDRKGSRGSVSVDKPFYSILGWTQPDYLGEIGDAQGRDDGLLHRFLFSIPKADALPPFNKEGVSGALVDLWKAIVLALRAQPWSDCEKKAPRVLRMTPEGYELFSGWWDRHRAEKDVAGFLEELEGFWGKCSAYVARISLILHYLRKVCQDLLLDGAEGEIVGEEYVDVQDVQNAITLVEYFKDHAYGVRIKMDFDRDEKRIKSLVRWLRGTEMNGRCTIQEVYHNAQFRCKGRGAAFKLLSQLEDRGLGRWVPAAKKGKDQDFELYIVEKVDEEDCGVPSGQSLEDGDGGAI